MTTEISDPLNSQERSQWRTLDTKCRGRMSTLWELVADLRTIRESRLYREQFPRFEDYTEELGWSKRYVNLMIEASEVRDKVGTIVPKVPEAASITKEGQFRELKDVPDELLTNVVDEAAKIASDQDKPITAGILREAREKVVEGETADTQTEPATDELSELDMALQNAAVGKEIIKAIRAAMKLVKDCPEAPGTEGILLRRRRISDLLKNAANEISVHLPKSVCPRCDGKGCPQCGNHGWVSAILEKELSA